MPVASESRPPSLPFGALLDGRYRLKSLLGQGGMGQVYEAEDVRLGRRVAIKVLHADTDEQLAERLVREAKIGAGVEHPAVATVFSYGRDLERQVDYIVMERLHGETLLQRLQKEERPPITWVCRVGLEIADVLAAVHAHGVIHRDLKPSNIFFAARGRHAEQIKLLDFGMSKSMRLQTITATGQIFGTPMYMAPEQFSDTKKLTASADVYAFGCILFECLAGVPPFHGESGPGLALKIVHGAQPNLRARCPNLPDALVELIHRCMRKRADARFANAQSLYDALREACGGRSTRRGP